MIIWNVILMIRFILHDDGDVTITINDMDVTLTVVGVGVGNCFVVIHRGE